LQKEKLENVAGHWGKDRKQSWEVICGGLEGDKKDAAPRYFSVTGDIAADPQ